MIQQGLNGLERTQGLSSDKVSTATRQKIRLVGEARRLWKQYKHKDAPRKGETKFSSFLGDILKFVGKSGARGWSTFRVMEVWAEHEQAHTKKCGGEIR